MSNRTYQVFFEELPLSAFRPMGGRMRLFKKDAEPPPDYTPMANASEESARLGAELGREQLAESRRQYEQNMAVARPVVDAQLKIMQQGLAQGEDYYNYMKDKQRPVEDALNAEAMAAGSTARQEEAAGQAVADVRQGTTAQQNQLIRQGLRYGFTPAKMAAQGVGAANQQALAQVTAANAGRTKEREVGFAKKLDVSGLYRGLPGASQGAYGMASAAGTSANQNNMAPGQAMMNGMSAGNATIMGGRQLAQQGLGNILSSQTSAYNASMDSAGAATGAMVGGVATIGAAML